RPARFRSSGIEDAGDVEMVHHRQGLAFGLEAGDHLAAVHAGLNDFQGYLALDGLDLLGHEDCTHAAFAELLQELVRADDRAGALADRLIDGGSRGAAWGFEKAAQLPLQFQQALDVGSQSRIARAGFIQVGRASGWISDGQCGMKDLTWAHGGYPHEAMALAPPPY